MASRPQACTLCQVLPRNWWHVNIKLNFTLLANWQLSLHRPGEADIGTCRLPTASWLVNPSDSNTWHHVTAEQIVVGQSLHTLFHPNPQGLLTLLQYLTNCVECEGEHYFKMGEYLDLWLGTLDKESKVRAIVTCRTCYFWQANMQVAVKVLWGGSSTNLQFLEDVRKVSCPLSGLFPAWFIMTFLFLVLCCPLVLQNLGLRDFKNHS